MKSYSASRFFGFCLTCRFIFFLLLLFLGACNFQEPVDFSTQVKPLLNRECLACHGGVRQQGGFSLLFEKDAMATLKSGKRGIVPGHPDKSEMIRRLTVDDPDERMPFHKNQLSEEEIDLLKRWIKEGASWGRHWAYEPIKLSKPPRLHSNWGRSYIDAFIAAKWKETELAASPQADAAVLSRRLGLDIIGMPTALTMHDEYVNNPSDEAYERLVDHLMESPHFGEKWATMWLDLARYADSKGYERDGPRDIWAYRDWLIRSLNEDIPYNQFVMKQLAGDLMPDQTDDDYVATAFHRNTMTNDEGGTDNEEFRIAAVIDRVNTTWEAFMGTSFACVQCHSHPYDPFIHEEYYEFMAFFNNTRDEDTFGDYPVLRHYSDKQKAELSGVLESMRKDWNKDEIQELERFLRTLAPARNSLTTDEFVNAELADTKWLGMRNNSSARLKHVDLTSRDRLMMQYRVVEKGGRLEIRLDNLSGPLLTSLDFTENTGGGPWEVDILKLSPHTGIRDIYLTYSNPRLENTDEKGLIFDWYYFLKKWPADLQADYVELEGKIVSLMSVNVPTTPVMAENPEYLRRPTHIFERGNWLQKGSEVEPGIPGSLHSFPKEAPRDRLGLATWITSTDNPLTSRTVVNRIWEQIFGTGLVETLEDMGTQGAVPTHPGLLDHLSWKLMHEYSWSLKRLIKEIVMSDTYRQSSMSTQDHLEKDPSNRYLARMPRVRLSAEQVRDQALAASKSLNKEMYGPPVMPYQPEGIWTAPYDSDKWKVSEDDQQYRRSIYTYWKRTSPYPSMITFDGVGREFCSSRRIRTNTPLQALVTLNDSVYVDFSRKLVASTWSGNVEQSIADAYRATTLTKITKQRLEILKDLYDKALVMYKNDPESARAICTGIKTNTPEQFAAMVMVSNSLLNLDEVIMKS